jgi:predicted GNAT family acetyltransferase
VLKRRHDRSGTDPPTRSGIEMLNIIHESNAHRLSTHLEGQTAVLDYELNGNVMRIVHTGVPREIGGRGVAAELMRSALSLAAAKGWTVEAVCSYAVAYMKKHPTAGSDAHLDELLDEALDETYPASDPPAVGGVD